MYPLTKITGPECPRCGCCQGRTLASITRVEYARGDADLDHPLREEVQLRRLCEHCGTRFTATAAETNGQHPTAKLADYPVLRCPYCQSSDNYVTTSPKRKASGTKYRHHKCRTCGKNFTTRERPA